MEAVRVSVSEKDLNVEEAVRFVTDPAHGAIDTFIGTVRNTHEGKAVTGITYDVHETLAKKIFLEICREGCRNWPGTRYYVSHYHGDINIGGISIIIAVSSAHRAESFAACRYVIEEIKKRAPIWKKEHYVNGSSDWLPGHSLSESETRTLETKAVSHV